MLLSLFYLLITRKHKKYPGKKFSEINITVIGIFWTETSILISITYSNFEDMTFITTLESLKKVLKIWFFLRLVFWSFPSNRAVIVISISMIHFSDKMLLLPDWTQNNKAWTFNENELAEKNGCIIFWVSTYSWKYVTANYFLSLSQSFESDIIP